MTEKKETRNQQRHFLERNNRKNNCQPWRCKRASKRKNNKKGTSLPTKLLTKLHGRVNFLIVLCEWITWRYQGRNCLKIIYGASDIAPSVVHSVSNVTWCSIDISAICVHTKVLSLCRKNRVRVIKCMKQELRMSGKLAAITSFHFIS